MTFDVLEFLRESNNIEGVWDDLSLQQAIIAWEYCFSLAELTPHAILKTHKILMLHQPLLPDEKGYFREEDVMIGGRKGMAPASIRYVIEEWCIDANQSKTLKTEGRIKEDHILYERIHPFVDGNGRTGRIFMNWQRHRAGLPFLVIKESEKQAYYEWFKETND